MKRTSTLAAFGVFVAVIVSPAVLAQQNTQQSRMNGFRVHAPRKFAPINVSTVGPLSADPTPGSSWAPTRLPSTVSGGKVGAPAAAAGPHPGRAIRFGGRQCEWAARGDQYVGSGEPNR